MLDAAIEYEAPEVVCEYVIREKTLTSSDAIKKTAFICMSQLEGWCSTTKASILIELIGLLKPETVVEIGVWGGKSLVPMACALKANEKGMIFGIDPWSSKESAKGQDGVNQQFWGAVDHTGIMEALKRKINEFRLTKQVTLIRNTSENAAPIDNIDMLHIDGNHSVESALIDLNKWVPLVKKGGLVIFDDMYWAGRTEPVDWLNENCIPLAEYEGTCRWGIWVKP